MSRLELVGANLYRLGEELTALPSKSPRRNTDQNARLHSCCRDVSKQLQWAGEWLSEEDWKRLFIAAVYGQKVIPGLDGGFVVLNKKSSRMIVSECSEVLAYIEAWCADKGVKLSAPEWME